MKTFSVALLGMVLAMAGCGKSEETPAAKPESQGAENSSGNPLTAPVDYLGAVNNAQKSAKGVIAETSVQQAIQLFHAQEGRFPKDLEELVSEGYLASMPTAPNNGRFKYDPATGRLNVVR